MTSKIKSAVDNTTNTVTSTAKPISYSNYGTPLIPALTEEQEEESKMLQKLIASQLVGAINLTPDQTNPVYEKEITYVTAANGLFKVTRTNAAIFKKKINEFKVPLNHLLSMEEGFELLIPKIPMKYLIQVLSYYRKINEMDKTEASVLFFWNQTDDLDFTGVLSEAKDLPGLTVDGRLLIYCPKQVNSAALSDFEADLWVQWFRSNTTCFLETHSHNTMNAFWSATDDANENMNQFYLVWGKVTNTEPEFCLRYSFDKEKYDIDDIPFEIFEWPKTLFTEETKTKTSKIVSKKVQFDGLLNGIATPEIIGEINDGQISLVTESEPEEEITTTVISQPYRGPFDMIDFPEDWLTQHKKSFTAAVSYPRTTSATSYGGYGYGYSSTKTALPTKQNSGFAYGSNFTSSERTDFTEVGWNPQTGKFEKKI